MLLSMRGTPYIYQGDEIGMTNVAFDDINDYDDVETFNMYKEWQEKGKDLAKLMKAIHSQGRDNARTPIHWNTASNGGFTEAKPWIKVNPNYSSINVATQENDPDSILNFYRKMVRFRKAHPDLVYGEYAVIDLDHEKVYAYWRWTADRKYLVLLNFSSDEVTFQVDNRFAIDGLQVLIGNLSDELVFSGSTFQLKPWQAVLLG